MKYILVRHVETFGNTEHRFNGHTESDYTERGLQMKALLEKELIKLNNRLLFDKIYASPIKRAYLIGERLAHSLKLPLITDERLKEFNFGIFDGLTVEEAQKKDPVLFEQWMADYNYVALPEGDDYCTYHKRISSFLDEKKAEHEDKNILIIAHGGTVHSLLVNLLDLPLDSKWHFQIDLGSIAVIECIEGYGMLQSLYTPDYGSLSE